MFVLLKFPFLATLINFRVMLLLEVITGDFAGGIVSLVLCTHRQKDVDVVTDSMWIFTQ